MLRDRTMCGKAGTQEPNLQQWLAQAGVCQTIKECL